MRNADETAGMECVHCGRPATRLVPVHFATWREHPARIRRGGYRVQLADMALCDDCPVAGRCAICREPLTGKRRGAKYCSDACKMKAHRRRHPAAGL